MTLDIWGCSSAVSGPILDSEVQPTWAQQASLKS